VSGELAPTGGGSIILAKDALPEQFGDEDAPTRVDGSLVVTKGGSYVIGRKYAGSCLLSGPGYQWRESHAGVLRMNWPQGLSSGGRCGDRGTSARCRSGMLVSAKSWL
jgi:hypothetical protein